MGVDTETETASWMQRFGAIIKLQSGEMQVEVLHFR